MSDASLECPVCKVPFSVGNTQAKTRVHVCTKCGGVWLDNDASTRIVETFDKASVKLSAAAAKKAKGPVVEHSTLDCPTCKKTMRVVRVEIADLDLDVCPEHGTWFDRGELENVSKAFQAQRESEGRQSNPPAEGGDMDAVTATVLMLEEFELF
jgi:Zn-finger nucleic acid-binding protein